MTVQKRPVVHQIALYALKWLTSFWTLCFDWSKQYYQWAGDRCGALIHRMEPTETTPRFHVWWHHKASDCSRPNLGTGVFFSTL